MAEIDECHEMHETSNPDFGSMSPSCQLGGHVHPCANTNASSVSHHAISAHPPHVLLRRQM
jgi:hypothetical protein